MELNAEAIGDTDVIANPKFCWCNCLLTEDEHRDLPKHNENTVCNYYCIAKYWEAVLCTAPAT